MGTLTFRQVRVNDFPLHVTHAHSIRRMHVSHAVETIQAQSLCDLALNNETREKSLVSGAFHQRASSAQRLLNCALVVFWIARFELLLISCVLKVGDFASLDSNHMRGASRWNCFRDAKVGPLSRWRGALFGDGIPTQA